MLKCFKMYYISVDSLYSTDHGTLVSFWKSVHHPGTKCLHEYKGNNTAITETAMSIEYQMKAIKLKFSCRVTISSLILINHLFWRQREKEYVPNPQNTLCSKYLPL